MKKILLLISLCFLVVSCGEKDITNEEEVDNRILTCVAISDKTKERLQKANTNPEIELEFLGTETVLGEVSACFLKVKITNPKDRTQADVYSLFDVVREKTTSNHESMEELERAIEIIKLELNKVEVGVTAEIK